MINARSIERRINQQVPMRLVVNRTSPQAPAAERLDAGDIDRLRSAIRRISQRANDQKAIAYGIWRRLREVTGVPAPHPFTVDHLPAIVHELRRCWEIVRAVSEAHDAALKVMAKRLISGIEEPGPILAVLECELHAAATASASEIEGSLDQVHEAELRHLLQRTDLYTKSGGRSAAYGEAELAAACEAVALQPQSPPTPGATHD